MNKQVYRYAFTPVVPVEEIETLLVSALTTAEILHGADQVRLDGAHALDAERRACVIDASTPVGRHLNKLFVGFLRRKYGEDAFHVERIDAALSPAAQGAASAR
jgi:hypothetical protein